MQINRSIVLYAEDDFDDFDLFREALHRFDPGIELHHARNGLHAIESLTSYVPDFIFLDINMPLMDGWECLDIIKETPRLADIPVYMISTARDTGSHQRAILKKAKRCFVKPYKEEEWRAIFIQTFGRNLANLNPLISPLKQVR